MNETEVSVMNQLKFCRSNVGNFGWSKVSSGKDGKYWLAARDNELWRSPDYGRTWVPTPAPNDEGSWEFTAVSQSGSIQFAGLNNGLLYRSRDWGVCWERIKVPSGKQQIMVMDQECRYCVVGTFGGSVFLSCDGGDNWNQADLPEGVWESLSISDCGRYQLAGQWGQDGVLFRSDDFGKSWKSVSASIGNWRQTAVSGNGKHQLAAQNQTEKDFGMIWKSDDFGRSWKPAQLPPSYWQSVSISKDGKYQLAGQCCWYERCEFFKSVDWGETWVPVTEGVWYQVSVSEDGKHQLCVRYSGTPQWSEDYGESWTELPQFEGNIMATAMSRDGNFVSNVAVTARHCVPKQTSN